MLISRLTRSVNIFTRRFASFSRNPHVLSRQVKSVVPQRSMAVVHDLSTGQGITWLALLCGGVTLVGGFNFYKMMERLDYYENGVDFLVDFSNEEVLEIKRKVYEIRKARGELDDEEDEDAVEEAQVIDAETEEIEEFIVVETDPTAAPVPNEVTKDTIIFIEPDNK